MGQKTYEYHVQLKNEMWVESKQTTPIHDIKKQLTNDRDFIFFGSNLVVRKSEIVTIQVLVK